MLSPFLQSTSIIISFFGYFHSLGHTYFSPYLSFFISVMKLCSPLVLIFFIWDNFWYLFRSYIQIFFFFVCLFFVLILSSFRSSFQFFFYIAVIWRRLFDFFFIWFQLLFTFVLSVFKHYQSSSYPLFCFTEDCVLSFNVRWCFWKCLY